MNQKANNQRCYPILNSSSAANYLSIYLYIYIYTSVLVYTLYTCTLLTPDIIFFFHCSKVSFPSSQHGDQSAFCLTGRWQCSEIHTIPTYTRSTYIFIMYTFYNLHIYTVHISTVRIITAQCIYCIYLLYSVQCSMFYVYWSMLNVEWGMFNIQCSVFNT